MSVIYELFASQGGTVGGESPSENLIYVYQGFDDEATAKAEIEAALPTTHAGLNLETYDLEYRGAGFWAVRVKYGPRKPKEPGDLDYNFEIGGDRVHITHSLETRSSTKPGGGDGPDQKNAIGVTKDGIEGTDIDLAAYSWSETAYFNIEDVDDAFKAKLKGCAKKVNDATFRGFAAGEVYLDQISGKAKNDKIFAITYHFKQSDNKSNFDVAGITVLSKKGWEYLWVLWEDKPDTTTKRLVKTPVAVYVERVYDEADFDDLGI